MSDLIDREAARGVSAETGQAKTGHDDFAMGYVAACNEIYRRLSLLPAAHAAAVEEAVAKERERCIKAFTTLPSYVDRDHYDGTVVQVIRTDDVDRCAAALKASD